MNDIISEALRLGLWKQLDIQFARMFVNNLSSRERNFLILAIITLSAYVRQGHVCLPLVMLTPHKLFFGSYVILAKKACEKSGNLSASCWEQLLLSESVVSNGSYLAPLILDKRRLYLYRMWKNECLIADFFYSASKQISNISNSNNVHRVVKILDDFFPIMNDLKQDGKSSDNKGKSVDWQKVSVAMALTRRITVISGGPGTGKTSIVSKLLIILLQLNKHNSSFIIKIATPTGRSSAHLNNIINVMIQKFNSSFFDASCCVSIRAMTLHKLLGICFNKENIRDIRNNFLYLDYLIIDESSMIDLSMMAKIITFLSSKTKVIFLGDHQQLMSVEAGSIFIDICHFIGRGYTSTFVEQLKNLTGYILPINKEQEYGIIDSLCLLKKNYRFGVTSIIAKLANTVSSGNRCRALSLLTSNFHNDLDYVVCKNNSDYLNMLQTCAFGYINYFKNISCYGHKDLSVILSIFNQYRILCVLREGPFGVFRLNDLIESTLRCHRLIQFENDHKNYVGRPIMVTANSPALSLFNGEIGVILSDNDMDQKLFAYFLSSEGNVKKIALHKLPKHETSFVMTVHKSQGSEFEKVALIFPNKIIPILSRELLYTGVTRARKHLSIYATDSVINYSIRNRCKRYSGLVARLKQLQKDS